MLREMEGHRARLRGVRASSLWNLDWRAWRRRWRRWARLETTAPGFCVCRRGRARSRENSPVGLAAGILMAVAVGESPASCGLQGAIERLRRNATGGEQVES